MLKRHESIRVGVASRSFSATSELRSELTRIFPQSHFNDSGVQLSGNDLVDFARGVEALVIGLEIIDSALLSDVPTLQVISKYGVGTNNIDLGACAHAGVAVKVSQGVNRFSVAELVISAAISLLHRVPESSASLVEGKWIQHRGRELRHKRVGIIGCGNVGKTVVELLQPFACDVVAYDVRNYPDFYVRWGVTPTSLAELIASSDVITVHVPLDESTRGMLGIRELSRAKPGAVLINLSRGGIVDEDAVVKLVRDGTLGGLALDVYEEEPPVGSPVITLPRCIPTAHIGGSTEEAVLAMGRAAIENLIDFFDRKPS